MLREATDTLSFVPLGWDCLLTRGGRWLFHRAAFPSGHWGRRLIHPGSGVALLVGEKSKNRASKYSEALFLMYLEIEQFNICKEEPIGDLLES